MYGSAPRVRGTGRSLGRRLRAARFSPACAGNGSPRGRRPRWWSVQPRVCGERALRQVPRARVRGSAPRVRGTDPALPRRRPLERFSPACAGNGGQCAKRRSHAAVQPRVCGERGVESLLPHPPGGSAPRVRGTGACRAIRPRRGRFSPACAGNGSISTTPTGILPVQPRVCGERDQEARRLIRRHGSAPRVRGTALDGLLSEDGHRFSPACAGNGSPCRDPDDRRRFSPACAGNGIRQTRAPIRLPVQPRVCGERNITRRPFSTAPGSAPRVRGTAAPRAGGMGARRFSPACAGNGPGKPQGSRAGPVQPRVCGERQTRRHKRAYGRGSAPRVRGTAAHGRPDRPEGRFSPACAGNGSWATRSSVMASVQPRVCGERSVLRLAFSGSGGSAPRVRGTAGSGAW